MNFRQRAYTVVFLFASVSATTCGEEPTLIVSHHTFDDTLCLDEVVCGYVFLRNEGDAEICIDDVDIDYAGVVISRSDHPPSERFCVAPDEEYRWGEFCFAPSGVGTLEILINVRVAPNSIRYDTVDSVTVDVRSCNCIALCPRDADTVSDAADVGVASGTDAGLTSEDSRAPSGRGLAEERDSRTLDSCACSTHKAPTVFRMMRRVLLRR